MEDLAKYQAEIVDRYKWVLDAGSHMKPRAKLAGIGALFFLFCLKGTCSSAPTHVEVFLMVQSSKTGIWTHSCQRGCQRT